MVECLRPRVGDSGSDHVTFVHVAVARTTVALVGSVRFKEKVVSGGAPGRAGTVTVTFCDVTPGWKVRVAPCRRSTAGLCTCLMFNIGGNDFRLVVDLWIQARLFV